MSAGFSELAFGTTDQPGSHWLGSVANAADLLPRRYYTVRARSSASSTNRLPRAGPVGAIPRSFKPRSTRFIPADFWPAFGIKRLTPFGLYVRIPAIPDVPLKNSMRLHSSASEIVAFRAQETADRFRPKTI